MDYLKDKQYYIDLYDLFTIKECLKVIDSWRKAFQEKSNDPKIQHLSKEDKIKGFQLAVNAELFVIKKLKFEKKTESIEQWMKRDREQQEKYDNTQAPQNIKCDECDSLMQTKFKILEGGILDEPLRVLYFFTCPDCKKKKAIYDNGQEDIAKPILCPKCNKEVEIKDSSKKDIVIHTTTVCHSCGYTENEVIDIEKRHAEREKQEKEYKMLLEKHRADFCLSEKEGAQYIETIEAMEVGNEIYKEELAKYDNQAYQASLNLKKISIVELEKLLNEALLKNDFIKLNLEKPDIGINVTVPFTVQDARPSRKNFDSVQQIEKVINTRLEDTNWRLVSNSTHYRLGYISGQVKGYEQQEDLLKLTGKRKESYKSKIDPKKRAKYEYHNLVQLSRLYAQSDAVENVRKRRLEKEPEGFFLSGDSERYNCGICGELTEARDIWWNLDGLRCRDCRRNILEGIIPTLKHRYDNNGQYIQDWQLHSDFSLHSSTIRKLIRDGILHGRELKRENGSTYCTIYLVDENREFLKKYPKNPKYKIEWKMEDEKDEGVKK